MDSLTLVALETKIDDRTSMRRNSMTPPLQKKDLPPKGTKKVTESESPIPKKPVTNLPPPKTTRRRSLLERIFSGKDEGTRRGSVGSLGSLPTSIHISDDTSSVQSFGSVFNSFKNATKGAVPDVLSKNNERLLNRAQAINKRRKQKSKKMTAEQALMNQLSAMQKDFQKQLSEMKLKQEQRDDTIKTLQRALTLQTKSLESFRSENDKLRKQVERLKCEIKDNKEAEEQRKISAMPPARLGRRQDQYDYDTSYRAFRGGQRMRLEYQSSNTDIDRLQSLLGSDGREDSTSTRTTSTRSTSTRSSSSSMSRSPKRGVLRSPKRELSNSHRNKRFQDFDLISNFRDNGRSRRFQEGSMQNNKSYSQTNKTRIQKERGDFQREHQYTSEHALKDIPPAKVIIPGNSD